MAYFYKVGIYVLLLCKLRYMSAMFHSEMYYLNVISFARVRSGWRIKQQKRPLSRCLSSGGYYKYFHSCCHEFLRSSRLLWTLQIVVAYVNSFVIIKRFLWWYYWNLFVIMSCAINLCSGICFLFFLFLTYVAYLADLNWIEVVLWSVSILQG